MGAQQFGTRDDSQDTGTIRALRAQTVQIQDRSYAQSVAVARVSLAVFVLLGFVGLFLVLGGSHVLDSSKAVAAQPGPVTSAQSDNITFAAYAIGVGERPTGLFLQTQGESSGTLGKGGTVRIGGYFEVAAGLGTTRYYWVEVDGPSEVKYGFVRAEDVVVTKGEVSRLDMTGKSLEDLLHPAQAVSYQAATSSSVTVTGTDAASGLVVPAEVATTTSVVSSTFPMAVATVAVSTTLASGGSTIPWMPATVTGWLPTIRSNCTGIADEELGQIVMLVESGGYPEWINSSNAHGLMQIVPVWHPECLLPGENSKGAVPGLLEPGRNVTCGCRFLDELLKSYDAGTAAKKYNSGNRNTAEGRQYYYWVTGMAAERHLPDSPRYREWLAAGGQSLVDKAMAWWAVRP